jgi:hypothetical protein
MNPIEALNSATRYLNSASSRTPPTFTEYLADLSADELLAVCVAAEVVAERLDRDDPAQSVVLRQVAAMAADVIDATAHDREFPGSPLLPRMIQAALLREPSSPARSQFRAAGTGHASAPVSWPD